MSLLFGDPNPARVCTEIHSQVRPPVLLCKWGKPHAVLSVQISLQVGLLDAASHVPLLGSLVRQNAVFSDEKGYELDSQPGHN